MVEQRIDPNEAHKRNSAPSGRFGAALDPSEVRNGLLEVEVFHHSQYSGGTMDAAKIEALLEAICQRVGGDWLLVGGSLVHLEYDGARATADIDLVPIGHPTYSDVRAQDELFKAAHALGLDAENVNSAARFFVADIPLWREEVLEWRHGPAGRVFRPTLALFVALKLARGTEIDLLDIRSAVKKEGAGEFREDRFRKIANSKIQSKFDSSRAGLGI